jgi:hypothetical protein
MKFSIIFIKQEALIKIDQGFREIMLGFFIKSYNVNRIIHY